MPSNPIKSLSSLSFQMQNSHFSIGSNINPCVSESLTGQYTWTVKKIAAHFKEAAQTSRRLPPVGAQGYWNSWPEIIHTPNELMFQEVMRRQPPPTSGEISRLYQTFEWVSWISVEERKIIWQRAKGVLWKTIAYESKRHRSTVEHKWRVGLNKISMRLNECVQCPRE